MSEDKENKRVADLRQRILNAVAMSRDPKAEFAAAVAVYYLDQGHYDDAAEILTKYANSPN